MSKQQDKKRIQLRLARLEIVAQLYKRGYSVRKIQSEVMKRLELETYSIATVHRDIHTLLDEWRKNRIEDMDAALQLELERIDDTVRELWEQWEKSKTDYTKRASKQKGSPARDNQTGATAIRTYQTERTETEVIRLGDPSYISEIRQQLAERRKLLGLYAPEKKDLSGNLSFASFLMESGLIDEAEQQSNE
ncbi:hypothetical protein [Bacteroides sp.]|uniref:hypothetical protein n=1 Tax=Bacteroides sp. TaxID=29523 RepID=UPI002A84056D|nr:hypothetical protein [Bacteroides sp.]